MGSEMCIRDSIRCYFSVYYRAIYCCAYINQKRCGAKTLMSDANSRSIVSNQAGIHEKLDEIVNKHLSAEFKKPIAAHTQAAFDEVNEKVKAFNGPLILDSCCGVGESTANLAKLHPDALVVGIDKSSHRLDKHDVQYKQSDSGQYILVQADLNDFWRLAVAANWQPSHHYLLYPNPWPKSKHIQRRWHGAAIFPYIVKLSLIHI